MQDQEACFRSVTATGAPSRSTVWLLALAAIGVAVGSQHAVSIGADASVVLGSLLAGLGLAGLLTGTRRPIVWLALAVLLTLVLARTRTFSDSFVYASALIAGVGVLTAPANGLRCMLMLLPVVLYLAVQDAVPSVWAGIVWGSERLSAMLTQDKVTLGPTGLGVVPMLLCAAFAAVIGAGRGMFARGVIVVACWVPAILVAQGWTAHQIHHALIHSQWFGGEAQWGTFGFIASAMPALLMLITMVSLLAWHHRPARGVPAAQVEAVKTIRAEGLPLTRWRLSFSRLVQAKIMGVVILLVFAAMIVGYWPWMGGRENARNIYILNRGLMDFSIPNWTVFGSANTGMFGLTVERLKRRGWQVREIDSLEAIDGEPGGAVAMIINSKDVTESEASILQRFVSAGGSALVLGDHTDIMNTKAPTNRILEPFGLKLNVDTAFPISGGWEGKFGAPSHPLTVGLDAQNVRIQQGTGATMTVRSLHARPVLVGRHVISDDADQTKRRGDLRGDYRYQLGEVLGDRCVAAEVLYGDGRVIAFADTSMFQNVAIGWSWPFVSRVFDRLAHSPTPLERAAQPIALSMLFAACGMLVTSAFTGGGRRSLGVFIIALVVGVLASRVMAERRSESITDVASLPSAVVDLRFGSYVLNKPWQARSIGGLLLTLERCGFEPRVVFDNVTSSETSPGDVYVVPHPRFPLGRREAEEIYKRAYGGATVVMAIAGDSPINNQVLRDVFGFGIDPRPLGPVPLRSKLDTIKFAVTMTEPQMSEAFALLLLHDAWTPRMVDSGNTIVAARAVGAGRLVVIADRLFLCDRSIEAEKEAWIGNIAFIRSLIGSGRLLDQPQIIGGSP